MNKRQVIIIWIVAIVLGAAVAVVKLTSKETTTSTTTRAPGQTLFASFPASDVTTVEISGAEGSVTIVKKDGKWTLVQRDDYPANSSTVNEFLRTLTELKVTRAMEAGPSFAPRFGMDESSGNAEDRGLTAAFKDAAGKEVAKVSLGKNIESGASMSPMGGGMTVGRYIRNHADETGFYAVNEMFSSIHTDAARWLASGFFSPEKIKTISLSQPDKEELAWKVTRDSEEAEMKLEGAAADEVLDTTAGTPLKTLFSYIRFDDVVPASEVAERSAESGRRTAVIETFEGFTYTLTLTPEKAAAAVDSGDSSPPAGENYLLTVQVAAELPKERKKEEGEKEEDAKAKDEAFTGRLKALTEKLENEKSFEGRTFLVAKSSVDALLKERDQIVTKATPPEAGPGDNGAAVQELPGGLIAPPPPAVTPGRVTATTPPIEAVTPPIAVPPLPNDENAGEEPKPEPEIGSEPGAGPATEPVEPETEPAAEPGEPASDEENPEPQGQPEGSGGGTGSPAGPTE
jgi:hypothetical protein